MKLLVFKNISWLYETSNLSSFIIGKFIFVIYLYLCERCQNCNASLAGHGNGGVNAARECDMYEEQQVRKKNRKNGLLTRIRITLCLNITHLLYKQH